MDGSSSQLASVRKEGAPVPKIGGTPREVAWLDYVARAASGDEGAFSLLYRETSPLVYSLALRILGNPADAEEVTVDVYTQVWRTAGKFSAERGSVTAWLVMLARSRSLDRARARGARNRSADPLPATLEIPGHGETPEHLSALEQQRRKVATALQSLPEEQRQALELAYFSDLTHSEMAARLGQPLGTVKTRIRLGMIKLREVLASTGAVTGLI